MPLVTTEVDSLGATAARIDEQVMIPELLQAAPHVRPVLDRYGLAGCGGPSGPVETLGFFARAHDVPVQELLHELRKAFVNPPATVAAGRPGLADTIYRPFFMAGIAVVLTLGAAWGAYLLVRIALLGSFTAAGLHEVNAHGHAQIFGWVGLFVMGFAYQAFPRFKQASLACPRLAYACLGLMLAGVLGRSVCEPLVGLYPFLAGPALAAASVEVLAITLFAAILIATWRAAARPLGLPDFYILSSLFWFILQAIYEAVYLGATLSVSSREELLALVATWQAPLRDIQIHGFALLMILGVSQRLFHQFYGFPAAGPGLTRAALLGVNAAVLGEVAGLVLLRRAGHAWAGLWYASVLLLSVAVFLLVRQWRLFSRPEESDRSLKFLRAAYVWLFLSLGMLVLMPVYEYGLLRLLAPESPAVRIGFSHAYYGAVRHAITVGFISLMIMGVAAKVVPTLNGLDLRALTPLWAPFLLVNIGCALRVSSQVLTDLTATSFPFAGCSGLLEVAGLALWGWHLWQIMAGKAVERQAASWTGKGYERVRPGSPLVPENRVADVLERYPDLLPTFLAFGFTPLQNPLLRRTLAAHVTLRRACRIVGVDEQRLLAALNAQRRDPLARHSLPVLSGMGTENSRG